MQHFHSGKRRVELVPCAGEGALTELCQYVYEKNKGKDYTFKVNLQKSFYEKRQTHDFSQNLNLRDFLPETLKMLLFS